MEFVILERSNVGGVLKELEAAFHKFRIPPFQSEKKF